MSGTPNYWKVDAFIHRAEVAKLRSKLAALLAREAETQLATVMIAEGLDPKANYVQNDATEMITIRGTP